VSNHLGYFPDIMPTLAELAGVVPPTDTDGISLVPSLLGKDMAGHKQGNHQYLYWEDGRSCAVRVGNWKAVRPRRNRPFELYDLSRDLEEKSNVAGNHPDILEQIRSIVEKAHTPPRRGKVLDASLGFKGHKKD